MKTSQKLCAGLAMLILLVGLPFTPKFGGIPMLAPVVAYAQGGRDPCADPQITPTTKSLAVTATAIVITGTTGRRIYVCGVNGFWAASTATSFSFTQGSGSTCGTSTETLSAAWPATTNQVTTVNWGGAGRSLWRGRLSSDVCVTVSGTGGTLQGFISFILGN